MRIATAAYPLDLLANWEAYQAKLTHWVSQAAASGADLLVFPEYGAMELAALEGAGIAANPETAMRAVDGHIPAADELHDRLAQSHGVHILAASAPVYDPGPRPVNQARLFGPGGGLGAQDKQIMTMGERVELDVHPGGPLRVFDTGLGRIGVLICYDVEFPLLARTLIEAKVEIILTPSCTEKLSGYWRVRVGAMARALEGQCIVVHSPTVGDADWCAVASGNTGAAAIYGPPDLGFPETGVLAEGKMNQPGWVYADIPQDAVAKVRSDGRVRNFAHWVEQADRVKAAKLT